MRALLLAAVAWTTILAQAAPTPTPAPSTKHQAPSTNPQAPSTRHQAPGTLKAAKISKWHQKTGGYVQRPAVGRVVVVNCQSKVARDTVEAKTAAIRQFLPVDVACVEGLPIPAADVFATCRRRADGANAALFVVDDPALPLSLMCADEQWALVNVANASSDTRFDRLFARGVIMAFGSGVSQYDNSPMQTVAKPDDLDRLVKTTMAVDNVIAIQRNLASLGVKPAQRVTYFQACQEGWAAAPTNDIQKAVWDRVHEIPSKPMKIEFDPKKDK